MNVTYGKKEKEIMKIKITKKVTYLEAKTYKKIKPKLLLQTLFNLLIANLKQKKLYSV